MNKKKDSASSPMAIRPLRLRMDSSPEEVRVEIVPLIDVIFCILTFFILAAVTLSRQQALSVDLPKASTAKAQGRQILMVSLNEFGQLYVEQEPVVTQEQFKKKLQAYRQTNPYGLMALYASKEASYNEVVQVLDVLRQVGGDRVALATLPGSSGQSIDFIPSLPSGTGVPKFNSPGKNSSDPLNDILKFLPGSTNNK
ncbi:MAG: biopolymer transporter ExbD [Moorea sp. SIO1G6]|uniref:ExbD/TolR family protein n=1 Tax=Moorena sp. SIO1G6 TaxID=2607840 RepID=UPI0013C06A23|nr:biopolymer transporter ExbD [Moorena sp. SIO1G6]NET69122.1 biopolymer transporter ExbD [Moorena sp. SIO1G6]